MASDKLDRDVKNQESRTRILEAAEGLFAEKGFDGARVDEIARRADVNKALIYYYFKSKEDILDVLFHKLIDGIMKLNDFSNIEETMKSPEKMKALFFQYLIYLEKHRNLLRIFLMESLKESASHLFTDRFFSSVLGCQRAAMEKTGKISGDEQEILILEFFTAIMPVTGYVVFKDLWCRQFGVSEEDLRERFVRVFLGTHVSYTLEMVKQSGGERKP